MIRPSLKPIQAGPMPFEGEVRETLAMADIRQQNDFVTILLTYT
jgi:hypothetical protein